MVGVLITDDFVIGSSYLEILGKRTEFESAECLDDTCVTWAAAEYL